jgi:serine/threonine protein phosphatase PrpC
VSETNSTMLAMKNINQQDQDEQISHFAHVSQPGKITKKIKEMHHLSKMGFSGHGVKKVNQDNLFIFENFNDDPEHMFMSVCDGHGMYGHDVSAYLKENLPVFLNKEFRNKKINTLDQKGKKIIEDVFTSTNSKLFNEATIDTNFSGSTCVSLIYTPEKVICANVGDSRAILGRYVNGSKIIIFYISINFSMDKS